MSDPPPPSFGKNRVKWFGCVRCALSFVWYFLVQEGRFENNKYFWESLNLSNKVKTQQEYKIYKENKHSVCTGCMNMN